MAIAIAAMAVSLLAVATARAAAPVAGAISATNIQGVSALLKGTVNPGGQPTTYAFQYVDQAGFEAGGFTEARSTSSFAAGSGSEDRHAAAAVSGLIPETTYHYRLEAENAAGAATSAPETFTTTHGFGFLPGAEGFEMTARAEGGSADAVAGSHPYSLTAKVNFNLAGEFEGQPGVPFSDGDLRDLHIEMPPGLIGNPAALPQCTAVEFHTPRVSPFEESRSGESCPEATQVGTVEVQTSLGGGATRRFGVFNLVPSPGFPAQLGFAPFGTPTVLSFHARPGAAGQYALTLDSVNFPQALDVYGLELAVWGIPWGAAHDGERGNCLNEAEPGFPWAKCSVGPAAQHPPLAYLSLPAACEGPLIFRASARSWQQPATVSTSFLSRDGQGQPVDLEGCEGLLFEPDPIGQLTDRKASSSSGFSFDLVNRDEGLTKPGSRVASQVKRAVVSLPEGVTINPSVGAGLGSCTPDQYAAEAAFSPQGEGCPNAAKIGDFRVETPLFEERLEGAIYLAEPDDPTTGSAGAENPFDSLIAVYLVTKSPQRGILIKVAGKVVADPLTGRLVASFDDLPQFPYTNLEVHLRAGQRAPLVTPPACGAATTRIELTPWVGALAVVRAGTDSKIETGIGGGPCPSGATAPFHPRAVAGAINSNVGSYTPFYLHLTRSDAEQEITSYSAVLPRGITGRLAGIPFCPDAAIAAARGRRGIAELADPSCPAASEIGHTVTGYGVGLALTYAPGRVYLAGPYHGSPLSIVAIDAATVGPFDLGTIVIRSAFEVDPLTAQLSIDSRESDPIPHILAGIPLRLREIRVLMDRPEFTRNPTSCEPSEVTSTLTGSGARFGDPSDDSTVTLSNHFQLLNCLTLGFRPKLGLRLRGGSRRGDYPALRVVFAARSGDANLKRIAVTMPHSEFLAQNHIRDVCTRQQFAADACPPGSVYGRAVAFTPLFDGPLHGPVYLRSSSNRLPDLVASLRRDEVHIVLAGRIGPAQNGIRTLFNDLPDAPITRFVLRMRGGRHGLLVNSANICASPPSATVKALGQNNRGRVFKTKLRGQCEGHGEPSRRRGRREG